jgi:prophage regulatory protein
VKRADTITSAATAEAEPAYMTSAELEALTGIPSSTWRFWAMKDEGPVSFTIGRRRVWRRAAVMEWLAEREAEAARRQQQHA